MKRLLTYWTLSTAALWLVTLLATGQHASQAPVVGFLVAVVWSIAAAPIEQPK